MLSRVALAVAAFEAQFAACAHEVPCLAPLEAYKRCYEGTVQVPYAGPPTFLGWTIGDYDTSQFGVTGLVGSLTTTDLAVSEVHLHRVTGSPLHLVDADLSDGIRFDNVNVGIYQIRLVGVAQGRVGQFHYGTYASAFHVVPSIPEPQTWALGLVGLTTIGIVTRRRRRSSEPAVS
jgi:hypothetical protein